MTINQIASSITLKILMGVVLSSVMIISILNLSHDLHAYLGKFENSYLLQFYTFGFLLLSAGTGLLLLFRNKKDVKVESDTPEISITTLLSFDFHNLGVKFLEGFINGALKENQKITKNIND